MAKGRKYHRRRRGRFAFLYKLLSVLLVCAVIIVALTMFFRLDTIEISGQERYSQEEILAASGLEAGDNLFFLNKYSVAERLLRELPYIQNVRINRRLPNAILIQVTESEGVLAFVQDGSAWIVSPRGKIVEQRKPSEAKDIPVVDGVELLSPSLATPIALAKDQQSRQSSLLALLAALEEAGKMNQVQAIHLGDPGRLELEYKGRFTVLFRYEGDYARGLRSIDAVEERLQSNETGIIDLRYDDRAEFRPVK